MTWHKPTKPPREGQRVVILTNDGDRSRYDERTFLAINGDQWDIQGGYTKLSYIQCWTEAPKRRKASKP